MPNTEIKKVNIINVNQLWNLVDAWKLGFFDGKAVEHIYRWSQSKDPAYIKSAISHLNKILADIDKTRVEAPVQILQAEQMVDNLPSLETLEDDIKEIAKKITKKPNHKKK